MDASKPPLANDGEWPNSELVAALLEIPKALREADTLSVPSLFLKRIA